MLCGVPLFHYKCFCAVSPPSPKFCAFATLGSALDSKQSRISVLGPSLIFNIAQLISPSVALPAELVLIFSRNKDKSTSASASCCKMHLSWNTRKIAVWKICTFLKLQTSSNTDFHIFLVFLKIWAEPNSRSSRSGALNQALKKGRGYLPEVDRQMRNYLQEIPQKITPLGACTY